MIVLGLTGSIGMGKTAAAQAFARMGIPVHDADRTVHRLLDKGGAAVGPVEAAFPGLAADGAIDRKRLGARVFADPQALKRLEKILHPLVRRDTAAFLRRHRRDRRRIVVLDIPLLFETGAEARCDAVVVVTAPRFVQETRVLSRRGMTRERFDSVRTMQMPDAEKRRRADFVVHTGTSRLDTLRQLERVVRLLLGDSRRRADWRSHARNRT